MSAKRETREDAAQLVEQLAETVETWDQLHVCNADEDHPEPVFGDVDRECANDVYASVGDLLRALREAKDQFRREKA